MKYLYLSLILLSLAACGNSEKNAPAQAQTMPADTSPETNQDQTVQILTGSYVSADYAQRSKGYDWVSVSIQSINKEIIAVRIRSRADKKKPTCSLDATATKSADGIYKTLLDKGAVVYTFLDQTLTISPEPGTPEGALNFYCSGGASIAGTYTHIEGAPDTLQMNKAGLK